MSVASTMSHSPDVASNAMVAASSGAACEIEPCAAWIGIGQHTRQSIIARRQLVDGQRRTTLHHLYGG